MTTDPLYQLKRSFWDFLWAGKRLETVWNKPIDKIHDGTSYLKQAKGYLNFLKYCHFKYFDNISSTDPHFWHFKPQASKEWYTQMTQKGFDVVSLGECYGSADNYAQTGVAAPPKTSLDNHFIRLTSHFAVRYDGAEPQTGLLSSNLLPFFYFLEGFLLTASKHKINLNQNYQDIQKASLPVFTDYLHTQDYLVTEKYLNFTLCPLIENIRRHYKASGNSFFDQKTLQNISDPNEKILWSVAKLRDAYLAHNKPFPLFIPNKATSDFSPITINGHLDYFKISKALEQAITQILGEKDIQTVINHLQEFNFPYLTEATAFLNDTYVPVYQILTPYINSVVVFYDAFEQIFGTNRKKKWEMNMVFKETGVSDEDASWVSKGPIAHRDKALHEYIPAEEIFGLKDEANSHLSSWPMPQNPLKQKERLDQVTIKLIMAYHRGKDLEINTGLETQRRLNKEKHEQQYLNAQLRKASSPQRPQQRNISAEKIDR